MRTSDRLLAAYFRRGWRGSAKLWRLAGRLQGDLLTATARHDMVFELDPFSYIDRIVLKEGFYESEVLEATVTALGASEVLWDIGANIGLIGLTAKKRRPAAQVVCFEPSPVTATRLMRNRELNAVDVGIGVIALSAHGSAGVLHIAPPGNTGMSTLTPWKDFKYASAALVSTMRGDDLAASGLVPAPHVIKLDVEGHEREVLEGLKDTLASSCHTVVFEDSREPDTPVKTLLQAAGFHLSVLERREGTHHALVNMVASK